VEEIDVSGQLGLLRSEGMGRWKGGRTFPRPKKRGEIRRRRSKGRGRGKTGSFQKGRRRAEGEGVISGKSK